MPKESIKQGKSMKVGLLTVLLGRKPDSVHQKFNDTQVITQPGECKW